MNTEEYVVCESGSEYCDACYNCLKYGWCRYDAKTGKMLMPKPKKVKE